MSNEAEQPPLVSNASGDKENVDDDTENCPETVAPPPPPAKRARRVATAAPAKAKYSETNCPFDLGLLGAKDIERIRTERYVPQPGDGLPSGADCEVSVAHSIRWNDVEYKLDLFKACLLCTIARNLKATIPNSASKLKCRMAIAQQFELNLELKLQGIQPEVYVMKERNTVLRLINVLFCSLFYERFVKVNDNKTRPNHETRNMYKDFWPDAVAFYNKNGNDTLGNSIPGLIATSAVQKEGPANLATAGYDESDEDDLDSIDSDDVEVVPNPFAANSGEEMAALEAEKLMLVSLEHSPGLRENLTPATTDLKVAHRLTLDAFRKKFYLLMKLRRKMTQFMTASGTGSSDPEDFVQSAMSHVPNGGNIHKDAILYFYCIHGS